MDKEKLDELNRICLEAMERDIPAFFEYLDYEYKVLKGEAPWPTFKPFRIPIQVKKEEGQP
jgi:hypothetical protein